MDKKFVWTEEYSVHVAEIDEQHKEFINIINSLLILADKKDATDEEALTVFWQLSNYSFYHLSTEEILFIQTDYKEAPMHLEIHNNFRKQVKSFEDQIRGDGNDKKAVLKEMAEFAGNWLLKHILITDKKYSDYFNEKGIK